MKRFAVRLLIWIGISQILALLAAHFGAHPALGVLLAGGLPIGAGGALTDQTLKALATWDGGGNSTTAVTASFTASAAALLLGSTTYVILTGSAGAATMTTPTAQQLFQQFKAAYGSAPTNGTTWTMEIVNQTNGTITLAGGTGVTVSGIATTVTVSNRTYFCNFTSAGDSTGAGATVTMTNVGSRTN